MPASALSDFRATISDANSFISLIQQKFASGGYKYAPNVRHFVTESSFLKIFIAWETFLESIFIRYMMGVNPITTPLTNRYASPTNAIHANDFLIGTSGKPYIDWSTPDTVRKLSKIYFGNPNIIDTTISSIQSDLINLKTIRNASAHMSSTTSTKLDALASRIMRHPKANIKVSDLLLWIDPIPSIPMTQLSNYVNLLDIAAEQIANG